MKKKCYVLVAAFLAGALLLSGSVVSAAPRPTTVAELAFYQGADRQQILEEGARKEGKLFLRTVHIVNQVVRPIVNGFQKRYPYIKVEIWRGGSAQLAPMVFEEYKAGRYFVDVITTSQSGGMVLEEMGILQPFYSSNQANIEEGAAKKAPGGGAFHIGNFVNGKSMGYNTKLISKDQLPKSHQDLLDPKWKGKMALAGSNTGVSWMGTMLVTYGEDFVRQLAKQNFDVHMISGRAILDLVVAGEYPLSPAIFDSHVTYSKQRKAPVDWVPLEPVNCNLGQVVLPKHSAHPHAAMLYIDFELSKKAGEVYKAAGYSSLRKDIVNPVTYKKYFGPESTKQLKEWTKLFNELFVSK
ncbi:ABC transporter substrate-binding protein [Thermodesulfobacteriota bacterium]